MEQPRVKAPDTVLIIFSIIVLAAISVWFIPPGAYETRTMFVEGVGEREVVIPESFTYLERPESTVTNRVVSTVASILLAPIRGITDPVGIQIIAFVLLVGGAFAVLQATGAIDAGLRRLVGMAETSRAVRILMIPLFMTLFSLGGATFGMAEEIIPFVLIFVPLALALGYDTATGVAIPFVGSQAGFAAAFLNPFTVGIAQGIAEVPVFSGIGFRLVLWVVVTTIAIVFVTWHATRVKRNPRLSPTFELDEELRSEGVLGGGELATGRLSIRHTASLVVFFLGILVLVYGVLSLGWYINELAALFVGLGIVMGIVGGLGATRTAQAFQQGAKDLVVTALVIGLARGILVVMQDGQVIDSLLFMMSSSVAEAGPLVSSYLMFITQTVLNFFVPSGSGQAALSMPLMAPLADLVGVTRQTSVLAFQMGDGFMNVMMPTSAVLMGILALARIPWTTWARWVIPFQIALFVVAFAALAIAVSIGY